MPSANLITTNDGRAAMLGGTVIVTDVQLSATNQVVDEDTTALSAVVATVEATGSVRAAGDGYALHIVLTDDSTDAYDVRALAVRLDDGTYLLVYSQLALMASKSADASLHLAFDLTIDAESAASITFGDADFALPAAGEGSAGIIELATYQEMDAATDIARAVTPYQLTRMLARARAHIAMANFQVRTADAAETFYGVAHNQASSGFELYVTVGSNGEIETSPDGTTWTTQTPAAAYAAKFNGVAYNDPGTQWVAVGENGEIQTSPIAGDTWSHRTQAASYAGDFQAVACGTPATAANTLRIAVGETGEIQTSTNGTAWTHRTADASFAGTLRGVAHNATLALWCIVGDDGEIQTSPDGTNWTHRTSGTTRDLYAVCAHDDGFAAVGESGAVGVSADGITWTFTEDAAYGQGNGIAAGDGFLVACHTGCFAIVSPDGGRERVGRSAGTQRAVCVLDNQNLNERRVMTVGDVIAQSIYY